MSMQEPQVKSECSSDVDLSRVVKTLKSLITVTLADRPASAITGIVSLQLATSIAYSIKLPTERMQSDIALDRYYINLHNKSVGSLLNQINEKFPIDVTMIRRLVTALYMFRYKMAHDGLYSAQLITDSALNIKLLPQDIMDALSQLPKDYESESEVNQTIGSELRSARAVIANDIGVIFGATSC